MPVSTEAADQQTSRGQAPSSLKKWATWRKMSALTLGLRTSSAITPATTTTDEAQAQQPQKDAQQKNHSNPKGVSKTKKARLHHHHYRSERSSSSNSSMAEEQTAGLGARYFSTQAFSPSLL